MSAIVLPMSFQTQAQFIESIILRCSMVDKNTAEQTYIAISKDEVANLEAIASRLWRMSPHEDQIKNLVMKYDG